ncbi:hypothetical protein [Mycobacterium sp. E2327]|nr:hypothetical protein [Mycobacterium sp. E2327]
MVVEPNPELPRAAEQLGAKRDALAIKVADATPNDMGRVQPENISRA